MGISFFFYFQTLFGDDFQFEIYFADGLKPRTRLELLAQEQGTSVRALKKKVKEVAATLRMGTACSGTDSPVVLAKCLGLEHTFSCEYAPAKQQWILANFPATPRLFSDVKSLSSH